MRTLRTRIPCLLFDDVEFISIAPTHVRKDLRLSSKKVLGTRKLLKSPMRGKIVVLV
jgi:hypothetical protein